MIKRIEDIDKEKREENREKVKKELAGDITEVFEDTLNRIGDGFKRREIEKRNKEKIKTWLGFMVRKVLNIVWIGGLIMLALNFVLGNVWVLTKLIKSLS